MDVSSLIAVVGVVGASIAVTSEKAASVIESFEQVKRVVLVEELSKDESDKIDLELN
jgi:collagenase-like PrtC family protease